MEQIEAKRILQRKRDKSWFGSSYNVNLYRGCPHGCIYCDSRSACYGVEDFARVRVKKDALPRLRQELAACRESGVVATGSMSDPYNPLERRYGYTRGLLELLDRYRFGAAIATKGTLVERDIDLLQQISTHSPVIVKVTITTPHDTLSALVEPHAPPSSRRLAALEALSHADIFAGVLLMPVLTFLEDDPQDIRLLVQLCARAGVKFIYPYFGVTLRDRQREYFLQQVRKNWPKVWERYLDYGEDYLCPCRNDGELWQIFERECGRYGILCRMEQIVKAYQSPYQSEQLRLF